MLDRSSIKFSSEKTALDRYRIFCDNLPEITMNETTSGSDCTVRQPRLLSLEIATYEKNREEFEKDHLYDWVVVKDSEIIGFYKSLDDAAMDGVQRSGGTPFLLRQIGMPTKIVLPASIVYFPVPA